MPKEHKHTFVCKDCGNEANMIIKEEDISPAKHETKPKRTTIVCRNCGNEANMILEEIEVEE